MDFDSVFYSLDWHPSDHVSFIDNIKKRALHASSPLDADNAQVYDTVVFAGPPPMKQKLWPRHCVQDSWGSELHKDLKVRQSYSLFRLIIIEAVSIDINIIHYITTIPLSTVLSADRGEWNQGVQRYESGSGLLLGLLGQ